MREFNLLGMKYLSYFLIIFGGFLMASCGTDDVDQTDVDKQFAIDIKLIEDYLATKNLTAEKTVQGIYFVLEVPGGESKPKITSTVTTNYKGYYLDDVQFDANNNSEFGLFNVIQGWQIGIPKFGKGGKGKLYIPSKYGYGSNPPSAIRKDAVLAFDIELIDFK